MSILLDAVQEARELREQAEREWRRAVVRAYAGGESLRAIGRAAGIAHTQIHKLLNREEKS